MKRKIYFTARERKIDQLIGFFAFPIVNIPLWVFSFMLAINFRNDLKLIPLTLPWLINGGFLILMFIFRPHIGVGYLVSIGLILVGVVTMGGLFLAACFGAIIIGGGIIAGSEQTTGPLPYFISFLVIFLGGLVLFCLIGFSFLRGWWILTEDKKENTP